MVSSALVALLLPLLIPGPSDALLSPVAGDYLEVRTCDVYTGPCFANAEVNAAGKEAAFAWRVRTGSYMGVDLSGLSAVAIVRASATLGDPYRDFAPANTMLLFDDRADSQAREALRGLVKERLGRLGDHIVSEQSIPITLEVACCEKMGCASLTAGSVVQVDTRCIDSGDHVCGNENVFYPPLTDGVDVVAAVTSTFRVNADALGVSFEESGTRGAFAGQFVVVEESAAPADNEPADGAPSDNEYKLLCHSWLSDDSTAGGPPTEIPLSFRGLLDPVGLRLVKGDRPIYDFWIRQETPFLEKPRDAMQCSFETLPVGVFVGALRSYGQEVDYRDNPVDEGVYLLRYGVQPNDGDHLGTAPSRDFVVMTGLDDDTSPEPVSDMDDLSELALLASSADHPMIFYLEPPEVRESNVKEDAPGKTEEKSPEKDADGRLVPRLYQHRERDEWIAEVPLVGKTPESSAELVLRVGVVLIGVSEHY